MQPSIILDTKEEQMATGRVSIFLKGKDGMIRLKGAEWGPVRSIIERIPRVPQFKGTWSQESLKRAVLTCVLDRERIIDAIDAPYEIRLRVREVGVNGDAAWLHNKSIVTRGRVCRGFPAGEIVSRTQELSHSKGVGRMIRALPLDITTRALQNHADRVLADIHCADSLIGSVGGPDGGFGVITQEDKVTITAEMDRDGAAGLDGVVVVCSPHNDAPVDEMGLIQIDGEGEGEVTH